MSRVDLVRVGDDDKPVLANLVQFYCYELSAVRGYEVTEHGLYVPRYLDHYFLEPERDAYFVRHETALAGFALARGLSTGDREVAEFFVMRRHRRAGVGRRAAGQLFAMHPGRWFVAFDDENRDAAAFWSSVVPAIAIGDVQRESIGPPRRRFSQTVLRFSTE
jgi:predicted acetyltransferase